MKRTIDHAAMPDELGPDPVPLSESEVTLARRVAANYSEDAAECKMFLEMLGLMPSQQQDYAYRTSVANLPNSSNIEGGGFR